MQQESSGRLAAPWRNTRAEKQEGMLRQVQPDGRTVEQWWPTEVDFDDREALLRKFGRAFLPAASSFTSAVQRSSISCRTRIFT